MLAANVHVRDALRKRLWSVKQLRHDSINYIDRKFMLLYTEHQVTPIKMLSGLPGILDSLKGKPYGAYSHVISIDGFIIV